MKNCIIFAILIYSISTMTCGGNCPDRQCIQCYCGSTPSFISISEYCAVSTKWNQNCCKCIVEKTSKGNQNYVVTINLWSGTMGVGTLPLSPYGNYTSLCSVQKVEELCDYKKNALCAARIVMGKEENQENWSYWRNEATACGCPVGNEVII